MIEFTDVSKSYGSQTALSGVSFRAERGDVLGYIGPNGAGKTTTAKILTGLAKGYTGTVRVEGAIGYLPQEVGLQEWRTVRHTLRTFALLSGLSGAEAERRVDAAVERLHLTEHAARRIVHLSGGMQQRVRFAQAIVHDPEVIILDEPLSGLDPASRAEIKSTIRQLADESRTILLSSHVLGEVEDLATHILILDRGEVRAFGTTDDLRERHRLGLVIQVRGAGMSAVADPLRALAQVDRIESVATGRREELRLHLSSDAAQDAAMRDVLTVLGRSGATVDRVQLLQPTLEELYLSLTGGHHE
jgi:ABC-2 type transport system ATP-binding protein